MSFDLSNQRHTLAFSFSESDQKLGEWCTATMKKCGSLISLMEKNYIIWDHGIMKLALEMV